MPPKRLPNLGSLRTFEAAARLGGLGRAGEELHVTHGAVSKQIQALEAELGEPLFERRNRGVHLTDRGLWLASRLSGIFAEMEGVFRDFRAQAPIGPLTVSCEPTLCLKLLIPRIADLKRATGLEVRYLAAGGPVAFRRDHVDLAVRRNDFPIDADVVSTDIAAEWMGPVLAPELASRPPAELDRLHAATRPGAWRGWDGASGEPGAFRREIAYEHFYLALQAAEAGQGAALASAHMVARDLKLGRLVAPWGFRPDGTRYVALAPDVLGLDPRRKMFVDWLAGVMAANLTSLEVGSSP